MIIIVGPSASGKTAIAKYLTSNLGYKKFVTSTTREPRKGEINSIDYNFLTIDTFNKKIQNNEFIEHTFYNGNHYGSEKKLIDDKSIIIVETSGLQEFKKIKDAHIISYFLLVDENTRIERMKERGDSLSEINKRIAHDKFKFNERDYGPYIDKIIDCANKSIEKIANEIASDYQERLNKLD